MFEERRYDIFISSTCRDLKEARKALYYATIKCGHYPRGMELFTPTIPKDTEVIEQYIRDSDIFVIVVGSIYGSDITGETEPRHYIQLEYDLAKKHGKPILAFLMEDNEFLKRRKEIPEGDHERCHDEDMIKFREEVKKHIDGSGRIVNFFSLQNGTDQLESLYKDALNNFAITNQTKVKGGWIRGSIYEELLIKTAAENPFFREFMTQLNRFDLLSQRCQKNIDLKQTVSEYFLDNFLGKIAERKINRIFFEAGSSIAYLSRTFIRNLQKNWVSDIISDIQIETNNILTFLDFVLSARVSIHLFPYGPPELKYGATFGELSRIPEHTPLTSPHKLPGSASPTVSKIREHFINTYRNSGILFVTASGIELSPDALFPGPHVGTYYSQLFKRSLLSANCPTVMFLDEQKLKNVFIVGKCFAVFDPDFTWYDFCKDTPFAIAFSARSEVFLTETEKILNKIHLTKLTDINEDRFGNIRTWSIILGNQKFQDLW